MNPNHTTSLLQAVGECMFNLKERADLLSKRIDEQNKTIQKMIQELEKGKTK